MKNFSRNAAGITFLTWLIFSPVPEDKQSSLQVIERVPGGDQSLPFLGKRKKFDLAFHHRLEQHFPDWEARIDYQKKQEELYKSARKKKYEIKRLRMLDSNRYYTKEELDAIAYFEGTDNYAEYQDLKTRPNIFDTRQSFLLKMHDDNMRNQFLEAYNRKDNSFTN